MAPPTSPSAPPPRPPSQCATRTAQASDAGLALYVSSRIVSPPRSSAVPRPPGICTPASAATARPGSTPASRHVQRRSEEHTSELQSQSNLVCRLLLEKKKNTDTN